MGTEGLPSDFIVCCLCYEWAFPKAWASDALGNLPHLQRPPCVWAWGDWQGYSGLGS